MCKLGYIKDSEACAAMSRALCRTNIVNPAAEGKSVSSQWDLNIGPSESVGQA